MQERRSPVGAPAETLNRNSAMRDTKASRWFVQNSTDMPMRVIRIAAVTLGIGLVMAKVMVSPADILDARILVVDDKEVLNRVNQLLCEKSLPFQFVTLFLFLMSPHGMGQFISAGHNPVICSAPPREKSKSWPPTASQTRKTSSMKCSERTGCWKLSARGSSRCLD